MKKLLVTTCLLAIAFCADRSFASEASHHWDNIAKIAHDLDKATDVLEKWADKAGGELEDLGDYNENLTDVFDEYMNPYGSVIVEKSVTYLGFLRKGIGTNFERAIPLLLASGAATKRCVDDKVQEPAKQSPVQGEPTKQAPVKEEPVKPAPTQGEPAKQTPTQGEPAKQTPTQGEPAKQTPTQGEPAKQTPAQGEPAKQTPAQGEPAKQAPVKAEPVQAPVKGCAKEEIVLPAEYEAVRVLLNQFDTEYSALLATGKYRP